MKTVADAFIDFALKYNALQFGSFTLKSGRISPYFFNAGAFNSGYLIQELGQFYAQIIATRQIPFDRLFGPAYKGIPLVTATAIALSSLYHIDKPYAFNRKEIKDHGEGGNIVGAPLQGNVLLIDDVITAGTAFREAENLIKQAGANIAGLIIMLDRQERGQSGNSAIDEIKQRGIPVYAIATLDDILQHIQQEQDHPYFQALCDYRTQYGIS